MIRTGRRRCCREAGWPQGRPLRLATLAELAPLAHLLAADLRGAGLQVELTVIPPDQLLAAQRTLVEKALPLPFDVLLHAWFDLTSDAPPGVMHREYYHSTGAFRAGPPDRGFEDLMASYLVEMDLDRQAELGARIDRYVHEQALSVFLCSPKALFAVNNEVEFVAHAATFELAETQVSERHWSRR